MPRCGWLPAQQRFESDNGAAINLRLRLKIQFELTAGGGGAQVELQIAPQRATNGPSALRRTDRSPSVRLGLIERGIGIA